MKTICALLLLTAAACSQTDDPGQRLLAEAKKKMNANRMIESEQLLRDALSYWEPVEPKPKEYTEALSLLAEIMQNRLFRNPEELRFELEPLLETPARQFLAPEFPGPNAMAARVLEIYGNILQTTGRENQAAPVFLRAQALRVPSSGTGRESSRPPDPSDLPPFTGHALKISDGASAPKLLDKVEPEYTEEARAASREGTVVLFVVVDEEGHPRDIKVLRPLGLGLDEKAIQAVKKWHFRPGQKDGQPVPVQCIVEVKFRLP